MELKCNYKPTRIEGNGAKRIRLRRRHPSFQQKKKLIEFITKHPELISCKVTEDFTYADSQKLWQALANNCNELPGAKKTWRQWRKTWQDLRSKTKKRQEEGEIPASLLLLSSAEQEVLGIKSIEHSNNQDSTEFIPREPNIFDNNIHLEMDSVPSLSEPESPPEPKVFTRSKHRSKVKNVNARNSVDHSNCALNCDTFAVHEQKKIQLKEDYINFKKDYLRQKLKLIKEQTEALKTIAKELCEK